MGNSSSNLYRTTIIDHFTHTEQTYLGEKILSNSPIGIDKELVSLKSITSLFALSEIASIISCELFFNGDKEQTMTLEVFLRRLHDVFHSAAEIFRRNFVVAKITSTIINDIIAEFIDTGAWRNSNPLAINFHKSYPLTEYLMQEHSIDLKVGLVFDYLYKMYFKEIMGFPTDELYVAPPSKIITAMEKDSAFLSERGLFFFRQVCSCNPKFIFDLNYSMERDGRSWSLFLEALVSLKSDRIDQSSFSTLIIAQDSLKNVVFGIFFVDVKEWKTSASFSEISSNSFFFELLPIIKMNPLHSNFVRLSNGNRTISNGLAISASTQQQLNFSFYLDADSNFNGYYMIPCSNYHDFERVDFANINDLEVWHISCNDQEASSTTEFEFDEEHKRDVNVVLSMFDMLDKRKYAHMRDT